MDQGLIFLHFGSCCKIELDSHFLHFKLCFPMELDSFFYILEVVARLNWTHIF